MFRWLMLVSVATCGLAAQQPVVPATELPAAATTQLAESLKAAANRTKHLWRDTPPLNADGTVNAYIEIPRGDRRKWEFDMARNQRAIDRMMPRDIGGYPVNYGFVPQTVSYDGDPFDVLVLGPPQIGGRVVRGVIVGVMHMNDEKGFDSKVVVSPVGRDGTSRYPITDKDRDAITQYFRIYKRHEPGKFSEVPGWGSADEGRALIMTTHSFFRECRGRTSGPCVLKDVRP